MKINALLLASAAFVTAITGTAASAAPLLFTYTPTTDTNAAFTFDVDSNPTPLFATSRFFYAPIANATGQYAGLTGLTFYDLPQGGAFGVYFGPQLYSGTEAAPTLLTGSFTILAGADPDRAGTLTISAAGAVPEPATWAMMLAGFGLIGFAARKRSSIKTNVTYA